MLGCGPTRVEPRPESALLDLGYLQPDQHPDPTDVDAHIRQLTASGNTPTGPALRGVVDSLKQKGFTSATLLLISDGESNCGEPPCEVAKSIVDERFLFPPSDSPFPTRAETNSHAYPRSPAPAIARPTMRISLLKSSPSMSSETWK